MAVPFPPINIQHYLKVSDDELASERDSLPSDSIAGPSTLPRYTFTSMASACKSCKTARFDEVPETTKLDYKSYTEREHKQTQDYS